MSKPRAYKDLTQAEKDRTENDLRLYEDIEPTAEQAEDSNKPDVFFPASIGITYGEAIREREERRQEPARWFARHLIPQNAIGFIYGKEGHGKTFVALDLGVHIAIGRTWHNYKIKEPAKVFYAYAEGGRDQILDRIEAISRKNFSEKEETLLKNNFILWDEEKCGGERAKIDVCNDDANGNMQLTPATARFERFIKGNLAEGERAVIIEDTFRTIFSGNENDSMDVSSWYRVHKKWITEGNYSFIVLHHKNKSGEDIRGSSDLGGSADFMFEIEKTRTNEDKSKMVKMSCRKMKDDDDNFEIKMKLECVNIRQVRYDDEDIEQITTLRVMDEEPEEPNIIQQIVFAKGQASKCHVFLSAYCKVSGATTITASQYEAFCRQNENESFCVMKEDKGGEMQKLAVRIEKQSNASQALARCANEKISPRTEQGVRSRKGVYIIKKTKHSDEYEINTEVLFNVEISQLWQERIDKKKREVEMA